MIATDALTLKYVHCDIAPHPQWINFWAGESIVSIEGDACHKRIRDASLWGTLINRAIVIAIEMARNRLFAALVQLN